MFRAVPTEPYTVLRSTYNVAIITQRDRRHIHASTVVLLAVHIQYRDCVVSRPNSGAIYPLSTRDTFGHKTTREKNQTSWKESAL